MSGTTTLYCWVINTPIYQIFPVEVVHDVVWGNVKDSIKEKKKNEFADIDADTLKLWKVTIGRSKRSLLESKDFLESVTTTNPLDPIDFLSTEFDDPVPDNPINIIIVQRPLATFRVSDGSSLPLLSPFWSPRLDTVRQLYELVLEEKLVHVRGTPGCGKTTLMSLLHAHIVKQLPLAVVKIVHSWKRIESDQLIDQRLKEIDPAFPQQGRLTFLLFDEGQDTYSDDLLWNAVIKEVGDGKYPYYRVVMFCSYGSPSSRVVSYEIGSPIFLRNAARISLWPVAGKSPIGILLPRSEFLEVVLKAEIKLNLHPHLLDLIFIWTVGHVGAVVEILRLLSKLPKARRRDLVTLQDFYDENPLHVLVGSLGGAFQRGLPQDIDLLHHPKVVALFRTMLSDGSIEMREEDEEETVRWCHRHGWIYAEIAPSKRVRYLLPSPLHRACLSWKLEPTNNMPRFNSLLELCFETISKFKPSQLQLTLRRIASTSTDPPEAQYQDEFYHSLLAATSGNVRISPEYASARGAHVAGRIDFFIPIVKWGIEITRDGDRLLEHAARFTDSGAYGAWLLSADMTDYILLDFRTKSLRAQHPNIPNLYHIVFQSDYQVQVYDNRLQVVKGLIALQENH